MTQMGCRLRASIPLSSSSYVTSSRSSGLLASPSGAMMASWYLRTSRDARYATSRDSIIASATPHATATHWRRSDSGRRWKLCALFMISMVSWNSGVRRFIRLTTLTSMRGRSPATVSRSLSISIHASTSVVPPWSLPTKKECRFHTSLRKEYTRKPSLPIVC